MNTITLLSSAGKPINQFVISATVTENLISREIDSHRTYEGGDLQFATTDPKLFNEIVTDQKTVDSNHSRKSTGKVSLGELPVDVAAKVKDTLTAYPKCYVLHRGNQWNVSVGFALTAGEDDPIVAEFANTEFYAKYQIEEFNKKLPDLNW